MQLGAQGLIRLLQLASPALPVGAYSYSQGLETAIADGTVSDPASASSWIGDVLDFSMGTFEAPIVSRLSAALAAQDPIAYGQWNDFFLAGRESAEMRAETLQMGSALRRVFTDLPLDGSGGPEHYDRIESLTFPAAFSFAAYHLGIPREATLLGYTWSWLENQVVAAMKGVPLGQSAGQRILATLGSRLPDLIERAQALRDDELSNFAPGLAIASAQHETQYSRLFRS